MSMTVTKLEEQWTPTSIQAAFLIHSPSSIDSSSSRGISVNLPLLNIGWTFALSLTPSQAGMNGMYSSNRRRYSSKPCNWSPSTFSFRRHDSTIPWKNTSMHAQLSLDTEQRNQDGASEECTPDSDNDAPLGIMEVVLAHTLSSTKVPSTTSCTLSSLRPTKVSLIVTISECPFANGFFRVVSSQFNDTETQARLVRQSGDCLVSQSLTTGKLFDVKFLTSSTRSTSGELFETYASLPVLEEHVNLSSAKLREEWTSALATLDHRDADAKHVGEILCPDGYEYELDSDFEDEDEASPLWNFVDHPHPIGVTWLPLKANNQKEALRGQTLYLPMSWVEVGDTLPFYVVSQSSPASDQGSFDGLHEEVIKSPGEPPHLSSVAAADYERTVLLRFAAHRTWYAFVWYCYTGRLEFSKLKSQVEPGARLPVTHLKNGPPSCSPKSMYRLADLIDDKTLKAKALEAIRERVTEVNVLDETFSVFTSKYPDVREVQLSVLMEHRRSSEVKTAFFKTMSKFSSMPHAEPALSAFYDRLV